MEYTEEYWDGFSPEEIESIKGHVYDDVGVDEAIEEIKEIEEEISRLEELTKQRIEKIKYELSVKTGKLQKRKDFHVQNVKSYALQSSNLKETKTQLKVSMVSGDVVIKKAKEKMSINEKLDEEYIQKQLPNYAKKSEKIGVNWAEMKKNLEVRVVDGQKIIYDKILKRDVTDIVNMEIVPEQVVIK